MECFSIFSNAIKDRLDPWHLKTISVIRNPQTKYPLVPLMDLIKGLPQYGANEPAIDGDPERDIRYIRITDIDEFGNLKDDDWKTVRHIDEKYLLTENDILFARSGATAGKTFIYKEEHGKAIFAGYLIRFRIDERKANPRFIFYYTQLRRYGMWVKSIQRPSGQPNINSEEFKAFEFPIPPLQIQNRIVELMQSAYKQKKQNETATKILLKSIDDFILDKLDIAHSEVTPKMTFKVWSKQIENRFDPLPYHPVRLRTVQNIRSCHFKPARLGDIANFQRTLVNEIPESLPYVGLENIESNRGRYIKGEFTKESVSSAFVFHKGEILFPKLRPYLNKVFYADFDGVCSTEFHVLHTENCYPFYLFSFLSSSLVVDQTTYLMTGNTLPRLQTEDIEKLLIPLPPAPIQKEISDEVKKRIAQAQELIDKSIILIEQAKQQAEDLLAGKAK